jgi:hypothetical protein
MSDKLFDSSSRRFGKRRLGAAMETLSEVGRDKSRPMKAATSRRPIKEERLNGPCAGH